MVTIFVEKYSPAKSIAKALNAGKRVPLKSEPAVGYWHFNFKGEDAYIIYGRGHITKLQTPEEYDSAFHIWDLNVYPCVPNKFLVKQDEDTKNYFNLAKKLFHKSDWIINATDSDREGELIFHNVYELLGEGKPWKRAWLPNDLTANKIVKAFDNLRTSSEMLPLSLAAKSRSIIDWLYGMNYTVALTKKLSNKQLGVLPYGRVQTPTLSLIVEREKLVRSHKKVPIWNLVGEFTSNNGTYKGECTLGTFKNKVDGENAYNTAIKGPSTIKSIDTKIKKLKKPLLFSTTKLESACNKKFGWDTAKTDSVLQKLYSDFHYLSYPRTDSEYITEEMKPEIKQVLLNLFATPEFSAYALAEKDWQPFTKRHFDNSKVSEAHTAIIPTLTKPDFSVLSDDEKKLYTLVCKTLISIVYEDVEVAETTVITNANGIEFKSIGKVSNNPNTSWQKVSGAILKNDIPSNLNIGDNVSSKLELKEGETKPPARFTEGTLLAMMETAGKLITDENIRTLMRVEKKGLGTAATRGGIINSLKKRKLITTKGKSIVPTEKGIYLIDNLSIPELKSADLTGLMEKTLNDIANTLDNKTATSMTSSLIKSTTNDLHKYYNMIINCNPVSSAPVSSTAQLKCPLCGKAVRIYDWGAGCTGYKEGCKFSIFRTIASKKLTDNQLSKLVSNGRTGNIKGFKSKKGTTFECPLVYDKATNKVNFDFNNNKK